MMQMIGRKEERADLDRLTESEKSEFAVVFGRRRVGKTYLVNEYFDKKFTFYHTGMANTEMATQLKNFNSSLLKYGNMPYPEVTTWLESFGQLIHLLSNTKKRRGGKKVVFIDEMPWLDTPRSGFIQALEYFWNSWASSQNDILLIVCGSSTSWMMNKLIKNHGGLHNRVTWQIHLSPFNLGECEEYFQKHNIEMNRHQIVENYMIFGGIPYYLSLIQKQFSMAQNIDNLCFAQKGMLKNEFENLYASLFKNHDKHVKIVEVLSKKAKGLTREEIIENVQLSNGGGLTKTLEELELCGFIRRYKAFDKLERQSLFQLTDFFTLFYFNFMRNSKFDDEHYWTNFIENARHRTWSGYAFEQVCLAHLPQIKRKLGISGILANTASWRSRESENGAQIDLLIARNDKVINLCEIKFSNSQFVIDKKYDENLRNKRETFRRETKTNKALHFTMITTYGVQHNAYWGNIHSEVTMDDLFVV
ncbi:MAG: ATP-binding protein [Bacteroidales bacterium]|jgi:AAA+ ATPase superfamily predicted ATPase|nr:ATP-binding protein [Bacteroidales bacterium]